MQIRIFHCLPLFLLLLAIDPKVNGQVADITGATSTPSPGVGHDYLHLLDETVDPANGGVSVRMNIPVPPGRGLTLPFSFNYDSNSMGLQPYQPGYLEWGHNKNLFALGPWSNSLPQLTAALEQYTNPNIYPYTPCYA